MLPLLRGTLDPHFPTAIAIDRFLSDLGGPPGFRPISSYVPSEGRREVESLISGRLKVSCAPAASIESSKKGEEVSGSALPAAPLEGKRSLIQRSPRSHDFLCRHVGVDHGGLQELVSQQLLDGPGVMPFSRRWVAKLCLSVWVEAGSVIPALPTASLKALWSEAG